MQGGRERPSFLVSVSFLPFLSFFILALGRQQPLRVTVFELGQAREVCPHSSQLFPLGHFPKGPFTSAILSDNKPHPVTTNTG